MKNSLINLFNSSSFRFAMCMAIVCYFLSSTAVLMAGNTTYYAKCSVGVAENSTDMGKVYVGKGNNASVGQYQTEMSLPINQDDNKNFSVSLYAQAEPGYFHYAWTTNSSGESGIIEESKYKGTDKYVAKFTSDLTSAPTGTTQYYYAIFRPIINVKTIMTDNKIILIKSSTEEQFNVPIDITVYATETLTATLVGEEEVLSKFSFDSEDPNSNEVTDSGAATGERDVRITLYEHNAAGDDEIKIKITSSNGTTKEITVVVKFSYDVTFSIPQNGSYSATQSGTSTTCAMSEASTKVGKFEVKNTTQRNITISPAANNDYRFYAVKVTPTSTGIPQYTYHNPTSIDGFTNASVDIEVQEEATVEVEFIPDDAALFVIAKTTGSRFYSNLNEAFKYGEIVVPARSGTLLSGNYEIPVGKTLVIPATDSYATSSFKPMTYSLTSDNFVGTDKNTDAFEEYRRLVLAPNVQLHVNGTLSVESKILIAAQGGSGVGGFPTKYGCLEMNKSAQITLEETGQLYVYGYIINAFDAVDKITDSNYSNFGHIVAKANSRINEAFLYADWRGGSVVAGGLTGIGKILAGGSAGMIKHANRVFPTSQYYIQNIEVPIVYEYGALEHVTTAVEMTGGIVVGDADMIVPNDASNKNGLFRLGDNARLIKYYNVHDDRLVFVFEQINAAITYQSEFSNVKLALETMLGTITLNTDDYVMPINHNIDIIIKNTISSPFNVNLSKEYALLPSSSLTVGENCNILLSNKMYIYDADEKEFAPGDYYCGAGDLETIPLPNRPNGMQTRAALSDASLIVNGSFTVASEVGELYTTLGGANITSTSSGSIHFNNIGTKTCTYQYDQIALTEGMDKEVYREIRLSGRPYLKNQNYSPIYVTNVVEGSSYTFAYPSKDVGKWIGNSEAAIGNITLPSFEKITMPVALPASLEGKIECELLNATGFDISHFNIEVESNDGNAFVISDPYIETGKIIIPVEYPQTNIDGNHELKIRITSDHIDGLNKLIELEVEEDYAPIFSANNGEKNFTIQSTVKRQKSETLDISFESTNVTSLTPGVNAEITEVDGVYTLVGHDSRIKWTAIIEEDEDEEFTFTFGSKQDCLADAEITFNPKSAGDKSARLILTAIYTDAKNVPHNESFELELKGESNLNSNEYALNSARSIFVGKKIDLFTALGANKNRIDFNCDNDGIVSISQSEGNYVVTGLQPGTVTIHILQESDGEYEGLDGDYIITVLAPVVWNWETLYYGSTHENPITTEADDWTLSVKADDASLCDDLVTLEEGRATIGIPDNKTPCEVKFIYSNSLEFTSILSPARLLDVNVNSQEIYEAVTIGAKNINFDTDKLSFNSTTQELSQWTMQFVGKPAYLNFTPIEGNNFWTIQESSNNYSWDDVEITTKFTLANPVQLSLKPTTRYVRIIYSAGSESVGLLQDVSVTELSIKADTKLLYLPLYEGSQKTLILTHTSSERPNILLNDIPYAWGETSEDKGGYFETPLIIRTTGVEAGTYLLNATQGKKTVSIQIIAYDFPLGLPIESSTWTESKQDYFYRYMFSTNLVDWDADKAELIMKSSTLPREIILAFKGAPDEVSFTSSKPINIDHWEIWESADGLDFGSSPTPKSGMSISGNRLTQRLSDNSYDTRFIKIRYTSNNSDEIRLSDLVIRGGARAILTPESMKFQNRNEPQILTLKTINLSGVKLVSHSTDFVIKYKEQSGQEVILQPTSGDDVLNSALGVNEVGDIPIEISWVGSSIVNEGLIDVYNLSNTDLLGSLILLGATANVGADDAASTGIWTGFDPEKYELEGGDNFEPYEYHQVNVANAFDEDDNARFDYLFIYGETTTKDGTSTISLPKPTGSNAHTPYYIYKKSPDGLSYTFVEAVENTNSATKARLNFEDAATTTDADGFVYYSIKPAEGKQQISIYMTGFCPYATTGFTKYDEGVWYIQGESGEKVDLYLEDCHIYSRNKTESGAPFNGRQGSAFTEGYVRGSGGVFVFECISQKDGNVDMKDFKPFEVSIHTRGHNVLKSNYGSFFELMDGLRAFQVSSPIQVHLASDRHVNSSKVTLNFDDIWERQLIASGDYFDVRTNGFLSLQKQVNNAPSIDLGNEHTTVNFRGGRIELQNAAVVSTNYKTTLAISHRSGEMGGVGLGIHLAYGIGTDAVGGTVNFYDGTTTVIPMTVDETYRAYYLMDLLPDGTEASTTSCLRCPNDTYVYGGSHCMLRACNSVTSKGGAPTDGPSGQPLGKYEYTLVTEGEEGALLDEYNSSTKLAVIKNFPNDILAEYYQSAPGYLYGRYGLNSVSPDEDKKLYFWIPANKGYDVEPEKDVIITSWKACMTEIAAGYGGKHAVIGGDMEVDNDEEVRYLLYCKIDKNIQKIITEEETYIEDGVEKTRPKYQATVKDPTGQLDEDYFSIRPERVGSELQNAITNADSYKVTDRAYYITTASADTWMNFTAPFDVENIYVVETYDEREIEDYFATVTPGTNETKYELTAQFQAKHNADFAAFFAMAMALGSDQTFDRIFEDYINWAKTEDAKTKLDVTGDMRQLYTGGEYTLRDKYALRHYDGTPASFLEANFYLYKNTKDWLITQKTVVDENGDEAIVESYTTGWEIAPPKTNNILLQKGETYSMLFPYCLGCEQDPDDNVRSYWDYWTGKFLIFEGTPGATTISGVDVVNETLGSTEAPTGTAYLLGNNSLGRISLPNNVERSDVYVYDDTERTKEEFVAYERVWSEIEGQPILGYPIIHPTNTYMIATISTPSGMPARGIGRDGSIRYGDNNGNQNGTSGHIPTVGGGNDLFITSIAGGINVAVAAPQNVRVLSSTGAVIYSGYVTTAVDIQLPTTGIYIISGENEVQKILF